MEKPEEELIQSVALPEPELTSDLFEFLARISDESEIDEPILSNN